MLNEKSALGALTLLCFGFSLGCEKSRIEREQEALDEMEQRRAEVREEETDPVRYQTPKADTTVDPVGAAVGTVMATRGLEAATVKLIAEARCAREQKCGNIGTDENYASADACLQKITADWAQEVNAYECAGGVVRKELDECLDEIRNEDCASPFDTLGRVVACRSSDICKAVD